MGAVGGVTPVLWMKKLPIKAFTVPIEAKGPPVLAEENTSYWVKLLPGSATGVQLICTSPLLSSVMQVITGGCNCCAAILEDRATTAKPMIKSGYVKYLDNLGVTGGKSNAATTYLLHAAMGRMVAFVSIFGYINAIRI